jgi:hypothetical protein
MHPHNHTDNTNTHKRAPRAAADLGRLAAAVLGGRETAQAQRGTARRAAAAAGAKRARRKRGRDVGCARTCVEW